MWLLRLVACVCVVGWGAGYYFEPGYSHHYTYWAKNNILGHRNVTTVIKFHVDHVNETEGGNSLHSLTVDSLVQYMENGVVMQNPAGWNLTKTFLFVTDDKGSVTLVHVHPEDHDELVVIKKAMVSVFSVHVKVEEDKDTWTYSVNETDHQGNLQHDYTVQRTPSGLRLERKHYSVKEAQRLHHKTMNYDHQGTLQKAEGRDHVLMKDRSGGRHKNQPLPGERAHRIVTSGDFPDIEAEARVTLKLEGKRESTMLAHVLEGLHTQTLEIKKKVVKANFADLEHNITRNLECLKKYPKEDDTNRTVCVNNLRSLLQNLNPADYKQFSEGILKRDCANQPPDCQDKRLITIDLVARMGDVTSQKLLVTYVLSRDPPDVEELRRVFIHCAAMENPTEAFVEAVEGHCFGKRGEKHGARTLNPTESRACLAVGSLAKHLANSGQHGHADRLIDRVEAWLEEHGRGNSHVMKREAGPWTELEHEDFHMTKGVLLHVLGNAALPRSRRHLLRHAAPNSGHHIWRRAALDALRHYTCEESARVLLDCMLRDEVHTVRRMALSHYVNHPRRRDVTAEEENDVLSQSYTYETVSRVKRSIFDKVLFQFKLELPSFDWNKQLGSSEVGASFGASFHNSVDGMFRLLSGYASVNVHDKVYADVHVGLIDFTLDIFRAEVCYKGSLSYNMNLVKDFTVGLYEDITSAFDHIANRVLEPMEKAANDLASRYQDPVTQEPKSGFDPLATAVKRLPKMTSDALKSTEEMSKAADVLGALPLVNKLQAVVSRAQAIMEEVHTEATDFFSNVGDTAITALPFAEREIRDSINAVLDNIGKVTSFPQQVFGIIDKAKTVYKSAMQKVLEGSKIVKQAMSFLSGGRSSWMSAGHEISEIVENTKNLVARLKADIARKKRDTSPFEELGSAVHAGMDTALNALFDKSDAMLNNLINVSTHGPAEVQRGFDQQQLQVEILKASYQAFKEAIDMVKSRIHALFGVKFHPSFPNQQRDCDDKCKCGTFPTECGRYGHPGVDVIWEQGWQVPSPVMGMMYLEDDGTSIRLEPKIPDLMEYQIFIANIEPHENFTNVDPEESGFFVEAGQIIGYSKGDNGCNKDHIHVAMKRTSEDTDMCFYTDPSPFLDTMQAIPKWHQECKEFTFKHIGQVIDFRNASRGFANLTSILKRVALSVGKTLIVKAVEELVPDDSLLAPFKGVALEYVKNIDVEAGDLKHMFAPGKDAAKNFFNNIRSTQFNLKGIINMAANSQFLASKLPGISNSLKTAQQIVNRPPMDTLKSLAMGVVTRALTKQPITFSSVVNMATGDTSGRQEMLVALQAAGERLCSGFKGAVARGTGSMCHVHDDCLGLECDVSLKNGFISGSVNVTIRVDLENRRVSITANGEEHSALDTEQQKTISTKFRVLNGLFTVQLKMSAVWQGKELQLSLGVVACGLGVCLPEIPVTKNIRFGGDNDTEVAEVRRKRWLNGVMQGAMGMMQDTMGFVDGVLTDSMDFLESLPLDSIHKFVSDVSVNAEELVDQVVGVRAVVSEQLKTGKWYTANFSAEFKNPMETKDKGNFPDSGSNSEVHVPFFMFRFGFGLGPFILDIAFDAGGVLGLTFDVEVKAVDSFMQTVITPFVAGEILASAHVSAVIVDGGIDLKGWIMKTSFPLSLTTNFSKQPVVSTKKLAVELVPLEMWLSGWIRVNLFLWKHTWTKTLWHYKADTLSGTIWEKPHHKNDLGPPRFPYCDKVEQMCHTRTARSPPALPFHGSQTTPTCTVRQLVGRAPQDPAVKLDFTAEDEDSDLKFSYAIGNYPGGTDIREWTSMRGSSLVIVDLSCDLSGKTLHFVVKAVNTQGLSTTAQCNALFDCTPPDGRPEEKYRCTSHPSKLMARVEVKDESPLVSERLHHSVGYSPSAFGHEVVEWQNLTLTQRGTTWTADVEHTTLTLLHGIMYYINVVVENKLEYRSVLSSQGTMADHTPPEPGPVGEGSTEETLADRCTASVIQRCDDVIDTANHRRIVDGKGATAVLNGNRKGEELLYTMENYHASANWLPFNDYECGIHGYTWAVGTTVCGSDVTSWRDPHETIRHRDDWTMTGLSTNLQLPDGKYYVSVQAVSDIVHGGDLVTTVCHSTPFIVDTSPPTLHSVSDVIFDEDFRFLAIYFDAEDAISGIARVEFGLGKTKYDVMIRRYIEYEIRGRDMNTYLLNEEFETESGTPAWIRLKVVNNVGMSVTGASDFPILIDNTPPLPGHVLDGAGLGQDSCCQATATGICVQWDDFFDPDSNIGNYTWGVGLSPGKDDVLAFYPYDQYHKQACRNVSGLLKHNTTYYSTVIASNKALNTKYCNASSDGVLVDLTPPTTGIVVDGDDINNDVNFTSETATLVSSWRDFQDPETGIESYTLTVFVNEQTEREFSGLHDEQFTDHSLSFQHGDKVYVKVKATNRAGSDVTVTSDGMEVDHTAPVMEHLSTVDGSRYQQSQVGLDFVWTFTDQESGIAEYRCVVFEKFQGRRAKFWPELETHYQLLPNDTALGHGRLTLPLPGQHVQLKNGASYSVKVTAMNRAKLATSEESGGVTVDVTAPVILPASSPHVLIARPKEEEEINDQGEVEHVDQQPLPVTWTPHDSESGIVESRVCIGLFGDPCDMSTALRLDGASGFTTLLEGLNLTTSKSDGPKVLYQVSIEVVNGAGMTSSVAASKPIVVLPGNVPGVIVDGEEEKDAQFSNDRFTLSASFSGFESEACGIVGYEWGAGTSPFATDILPYSQYGLTVTDKDSGSGVVQAPLMLFEGVTYYVTVRAITGHACHEPYIVSSSDGVTIDTTPPAVTFHILTSSDDAESMAEPAKVEIGREISSSDVVYQTEGDKLAVGWAIEDRSGANYTAVTTDVWSSSPQTVQVSAESTDPAGLWTLPKLAHAMSPGQTLFQMLHVSDGAGNEMTSWMPVVTMDNSPPAFLDLQCTKFVSTIASLVKCSWRSVDESHSALKTLKVGLGSGPVFADLYNMTSMPLHSREWTIDADDYVEDDVTEFYVILQAVNTAGLETTVPVKVQRDVTPPEYMNVTIVTSPEAGYHETERKCQTSEDYMEIVIEGLEDSESGVESVEIALGSSEGRSDLYSFRTYPKINGMYALGSLGLARGTTVFATVRLTNGVGLYAVATSKGVAISPEPRLEVWDGLDADHDLDGQVELNLIQGQWRYSDACPITRAQWRLTELGGTPVTNFTDVPGAGREFQNDRLELENLKTYVITVKVEDAIGRTLTAFSDGITVLIREPLPGTVRDGQGQHDIQYQKSLHSLSANWDPFGDARSSLPSDQIARYEVALGTDRRYSTTKSNIHAFQDVGLATSYTFKGLNLTSHTVTYYVTVRAYSAAGSFSESSSDGVRAGYSGEVTPGRVTTGAYQSETDSIRVAWSDFVSDMGSLRFYTGVSSILPDFDNVTHDCQELLKGNFTFDTRKMKLQDDNTSGPKDGDFTTTIKDLNLAHNGTYYVTVVGEDRMGHCAAAVSDQVLVDVTPPVDGDISADAYVTDTAIFLRSDQTLTVIMDDFPDPESGVEKTEVELMSSSDCSLASEKLSVIRGVTAVHSSDPSNDAQSYLNDASDTGQVTQNRITMRGLQLLENHVYYLRITVTNGAGLKTTATSKPILLDLSPPSPGVVKVGSDWTAGVNQVYLGQTHTVPGIIALRSLKSDTLCPTQLDLLSQEKLKQWKAMGIGAGFMPESAFLESSGLSVVLQHNAYLTGMDKGALYYEEAAWREGNYTFRLTPGKGDHVLSGIAMTSPDLLPPFLIQNGLQMDNESSLPCDPSTTNCQIDTSNETAEGSLFAEADYGVGFSFLDVNGTIQALFWAQDRFRLKQQWVSLDFNPSSTVADYTFSLTKLKNNAGDSWQVSIIVNGKVSGVFSGLVFQARVMISLYTWNFVPGVQDDYVPPVVDPLAPFKAVTHLTSLAMPLPQRPSCSYGAPFHDGQSGIKEVLVGVSDDFNQTANVAAFQSVMKFCVPCLLDCKKICTDSCHDDHLSTSFSVRDFSVTGLNLQATNISLMSNISLSRQKSQNATHPGSEFDLPIYYLDVRVISHSGLFTDVKSKPVLIDVTPPEVNYIYAVDPTYADDEAMEFLGNNYTVGIQWDVSDDVSAVQQQWVSLGTEPGSDDIVAKVSVDRYSRHYIFEHLDGKLVEHHVYHITLLAVNEADLATEVSVNFTVYTTPPDLVGLSLSQANASVMEIDGKKVAVSDSTDALALDVQLDMTVEKNLEYLEWSVGAADSVEGDIFPKTRVATSSTPHTQVGIIGGYMHFKGAPSNITVGDFVGRNMTQQAGGTSTGPRSEQARFLLEPGRCLKQRVYGVSKSHTQNHQDLTPTCIKRKGDRLLQAGNTTKTLWISGQVLSDTPPSAARDSKIKLKVKKGAMTVGMLSNNDLDNQYGSAASTEYSPFIVKPDAKTDATSRLLRKRLHSFTGPHLFLAPVLTAELSEDVDVTLTLPPSVSVPPDHQPRVLYWDKELGEWRSPVDVCEKDTTTYNMTARLVHAKLCSRVFALAGTNTTSLRSKRSPSVPGIFPATLPRMITVALVQTSAPNTAPTVHSSPILLAEDAGKADVTLSYEDDEGDVLEFMVVGRPQHGTAVVSPDGKLQYTPDPNYTGSDVIHLQAREMLDAASLAAGITPHVVDVTLNVTVSSVNDPPALFYLPVANSSTVSQNVLVGPTAGTGLNMSVLVEGNSTTHASLGLIVFGDVDLNDTLDFHKAVRGSHDVTFTVSDVSTRDPRLAGYSITGAPSGVGAKEISITITEGGSGLAIYEARLSDSLGAFSLQLTLNVYVLISPCFHGHCKGTKPSLPCLDSQRTFTFDQFICECDLGYEGQWCETETNECKQATCSPIHDCVDLIGSYRCDVNASKMVAIILCPILAIFFIAAAVYKWKKRPSKVSDMKKSLFDDDDLVKPSKYGHDNPAFVVQRSPYLEEQFWASQQSQADNEPDVRASTSEVRLSTGIPSIIPSPAPVSSRFNFEAFDFFAFKSGPNPSTARVKSAKSSDATSPSDCKSPSEAKSSSDVKSPSDVRSLSDVTTRPHVVPLAGGPTWATAPSERSGRRVPKLEGGDGKEESKKKKRPKPKKPKRSPRELTAEENKAFQDDTNINQTRESGLVDVDVDFEMSGKPPTDAALNNGLLTPSAPNDANTSANPGSSDHFEEFQLNVEASSGGQVSVSHQGFGEEGSTSRPGSAVVTSAGGSSSERLTNIEA